MEAPVQPFASASQDQQAQHKEMATLQKRIPHMVPCQISGILSSTGKLAIYLNLTLCIKERRAVPYSKRAHRAVSNTRLSAT